MVFDIVENDIVQVIKGDVRDTLQPYLIDKIALLHMDFEGEVNKFCLEKLYHKVVEGGFIFIDNYVNNWETHQAVNEYLMAINFDPRKINFIEGKNGCYWCKCSHDDFQAD